MMKKRTKTYDQFNIVLVPFPFIELEKSKKRPAVILSQSEAFNTEQYRKIRQAMLLRDCKNISPCNRRSQIYGHDMNISIFDTRVRIEKDV